MRAKQAKQFVQHYFPEIRPNLFHISFLFSFVIMMGLCLPPLQNLRFPRSNLLDGITYILDPSALQLFSVFLLIYVTYKYFYKASSNAFLSALMPFIFVGTFLLFGALIEEYIFKSTFQYNRPENSMPEPWLTNFMFSHIFTHATRKGTATPSGYAFRQTFILLMFLLLTQQKNWKNIMGIGRMFINTSSIIYALNFTFLILVSLSRVYRGTHYLFDIGIGIGLGTFLFWVLTAFVCFLAHREKQREFLRDLSFHSITYTVTMLFFSQETVYWLGISWFFLVVIGLLYNKSGGVVQKLNQR